VHKFCADVVDNLRTQAAFVSGLLQAQQTDKTWKEEAEATIKQIQKAGNELEKKVLEMQDVHTLVRLDQEDKNKASKELMKEVNAAVTQLQDDIVEQNDVNGSH
jgi:peptidoglycan hydrolase CwlO-like protein